MQAKQKKRSHKHQNKNHKIMRYLIKIEGGELGETELDAHDIEQAEESARRWVLDGYWGHRGREEFVAFTILDENEVEWVFDQAIGGFAEPDCAEGHAHEWKSPHELVGGDECCPGIFDHGDDQYRFEVVCEHCGRYRTTITAGGPVLESRQTYRRPDERSLAWVEACRINGQEQKHSITGQLRKFAARDDFDDLIMP
jgi:hypothetical protein